MDFQTALSCQLFRDEAMHLGLHGSAGVLSGFPFETIGSFDAMGALLGRNLLLGDDGAVTAMLPTAAPAEAHKDLSSVASSSSSSDAAAGLMLQRYFQLHALTLPNAVVRTVGGGGVGSSSSGETKDEEEVSTSARVGVIRSVTFALPRLNDTNDGAAKAAVAANPTGPSATLAAFVADYASRMIFLRIDFGNAVEDKVPLRRLSNDPFSAAEFAALTAAIVAGVSSAPRQGAAGALSSVSSPFTSAGAALEFFFRESPAITQMRLYPCRLVAQSSSSSTSTATTAVTAPLPKRAYPQALSRSFVSSEPQRAAFGGLFLTRAVQQLIAFEGIVRGGGGGGGGQPSSASADSDDANEGTANAGSLPAADEPTLTYRELNALLETVIAPQLERLQQSLLEQSCYGTAAAATSPATIGVSNNANSSMAQLEEGRREVFRVQQLLKEARDTVAAQRAQLDGFERDLAAERANVREVMKTNAALVRASDTWKERALGLRGLLDGARSMLKMDDAQGPEEVLQIMRRRLGQ